MTILITDGNLDLKNRKTYSITAVVVPIKDTNCRVTDTTDAIGDVN